jgi:hypothetical protein
MADLCLLGEGDGPGRSVAALPALQRLAMLHLVDASLRRAAEDSSSCGEVVLLEDAANALMPRLSPLLGLFGSDELAMAPLAAMMKMLLEHACRHIKVGDAAARHITAIPPRVLLPSMLSAISKQMRLRTSENLIDALLVLARQSSEAHKKVLSLAKEMRDRSLILLRTSTGSINLHNLAPCLLTLLTLCNRGIDVSLGHYGLLKSMLEVVSSPFDLTSDSTSGSATCILLQLLELSMLLIMWRIRAVVSSAAAETPHVSRLDLDDVNQQNAGGDLCGSSAMPQDHEELPNAVRRLFDACARLLGQPYKSSRACGTLVKLQAMSTYLTLLQGVLGADGHLGNLQGFASKSTKSVKVSDAIATLDVPKSHVSAVEIGLASLYSAAYSCMPKHIRSEDAMQACNKDDLSLSVAGQQLSACRKMLNRFMEPAVDDIDLTSEEFCLAASGAAWMVSHSEIEAIFAGPPGRCVLAHAANTSLPRSVRDVAVYYVRRLRQQAGRSVRDSVHSFNVQLAAVAYVISRHGTDAGHNLFEILQSATGTVAAVAELPRLEAGFCQAVCGYVNSAAACRDSAQLEAILLWLRSSSGCFLSASDATSLHRELAVKFGHCIIQGAVGQFDSSMRTLLTALQPLGNVITEREQRHAPGTWRLRLAREARRRLKQRKLKASALPAPTEWLGKRVTAKPSLPSQSIRRALIRKRTHLEARDSSGVATQHSAGEGLGVTAVEAVLPSLGVAGERQKAVRKGKGKQRRRLDNQSVAKVEDINKVATPASTELRSLHPGLQARPRALSGLKRSSAHIDLDGASIKTDGGIKEPRLDIAAPTLCEASPQPAIRATRQWRLRRVEGLVP